MSMNDLTADMLTRIRNAVRNKATEVTVVSNKLNRGVAEVLVDEGYINGFDCVEDGRQGLIKIELKYGRRGEVLINSLDRVSKGGCRVYRGADDLPRPSRAWESPSSPPARAFSVIVAAANSGSAARSWRPSAEPA